MLKSIAIRQNHLYFSPNQICLCRWSIGSGNLSSHNNDSTFCGEKFQFEKLAFSTYPIKKALYLVIWEDSLGIS